MILRTSTCLEFRAPIALFYLPYIVNYKSKPGFSVSDVLMLEVINSMENPNSQKITVTVERGFQW